MKNNLNTRIHNKLQKLKALKVEADHSDFYKLNRFIIEYTLMLQLLTENDEIDLEKFHLILEDKKINTEELISKWFLDI